MTQYGKCLAKGEKESTSIGLVGPSCEGCGFWRKFDKWVNCFATKERAIFLIFFARNDSVTVLFSVSKSRFVEGTRQKVRTKILRFERTSAQVERPLLMMTRLFSNQFGLVVVFF